MQLTVMGKLMMFSPFLLCFVFTLGIVMWKGLSYLYILSMFLTTLASIHVTRDCYNQVNANQCRYLVVYLGLMGCLPDDVCIRIPYVLIGIVLVFWSLYMDFWFSLFLQKMCQSRELL